MKMVANFAKKTNGINMNQLEHSIRRNFGGLDHQGYIRPIDIFKQHCRTALEHLRSSGDGTPPTDAIELIDACLSGQYTSFSG